MMRDIGAFFYCIKNYRNIVNDNGKTDNIIMEMLSSFVIEKNKFCYIREYI
ncbi:hypothetical protein SH1V18_05050 [Vallitalea longa]|uniref:Uncharacterized protein n=1 Tax=Vallitalea longa TaxID=2936439 RepID=A0A9W5Y8N8_9FIRM|nr:hypothetical protein SH1V18_05050 [Vallitalea longa]